MKIKPSRYKIAKRILDNFARSKYYCDSERDEGFTISEAYRFIRNITSTREEQERLKKYFDDRWDEWN